MDGKNDASLKLAPNLLSSQATCLFPSSINILHLPDRVRHQIYELVLNVLHPLYLYQDSSSSVQTFAPDKPKHWTALLYTNRQIHIEASAALYRVNRFELVDMTKPQVGALRCFLDRIGPSNATSLSHLCISLPSVVSNDEEPGKVQLRDDSKQILKLIQDKCTSLTTLETTVHYRNSALFTQTDKSLLLALSYVDLQLRTIRSLEKIIVRVETHSDVPTPAAKEMMHRLGWVLFAGTER
jgi:hypothetical protein